MIQFASAGADNIPKKNQRTKTMIQKQNTFPTHLEPIYGTTLDNGRKPPDTVPKAISYGTHSQHNVQLVPHYRYKQVEKSSRTPICLQTQQNKGINVTFSCLYQERQHKIQYCTTARKLHEMSQAIHSFKSLLTVKTKKKSAKEGKLILQTKKTKSVNFPNMFLTLTSVSVFIFHINKLNKANCTTHASNMVLPCSSYIPYKNTVFKKYYANFNKLYGTR